MPNPASYSDVAIRFWRPLTAAEQSLVTVLLDDAWYVHVLVRRPNIDADMAAGTVRPEAVVAVLAEMVKRVLLNPEGMAQERIDDYTGVRDAATASGQLHLLPAELASLTPVIPTASSRNSVRLVAYGEL